jgi:hypothetical protein
MFSACLLTTAISLAGVIDASCSQDDRGGLSPETADSILKSEPLTIVFQKTIEDPTYSGPYEWCFSINSAGQTELTMSLLDGLTKRKFEISATKLAAIRKCLRDEKFVELKNSYGKSVLHGGWSTITVIAGEHVKKTVRYNSTYAWASRLEQGKLNEAMPALRVWLKICEAVDPEASAFPERRPIVKSLEAMKSTPPKHFRAQFSEMLPFQH